MAFLYIEHEGETNFMKKSAFTLAETLIILGIIGIVAALTIPGLLNNYLKKQTATQLQKSISIMNQAYKLSFEDLGELSASETKDLDSKEYFNTYWAPYIKALTYCETITPCGYKSYTPFTQTNRKKSIWYIVEPRLRPTFITPDGTVYAIFLSTWSGDPNTNKKQELYQIIVDLNGGAKPNKFGRDVFWLSRTQDNGGGIRPYCYQKTDKEINKDCSKSGIGECCAEKIRRAGWEITQDYPW